MKSRPVFYVPTMDIFEFLADTRGFVDGVLVRIPAGAQVRRPRTHPASRRSRRQP